MAFQHSRRSLFTVLLLLIAVFVICYQQFLLIKHDIHAAFALEQIGIFNELSNPNIRDGVIGIESKISGVREYYPSGTKQEQGTTLDKIVEECRRAAIEQLKKRKSS